MLNFNTTAPIYIQIMDLIKRDIVTGVLVPGGRVDSVRALSEKFGVNLNTMQRACSALERQGIIYTQRGVGSFVTEDEKVIQALKQGMSEDLIRIFITGMESIGYQKTDILEIVRKELMK
jgi:GntR family transcriptional regulator